MIWRSPKKLSFLSHKRREIYPEEILLDSTNPLSKTYNSFIEKPIEYKRVITVGIIFIAIVVGYTLRATELQIIKGEEFAYRSVNNKLETHRLWAERGLIKDRNGVSLAWNEASSTQSSQLPLRQYSNMDGLSHILGFVRYPKLDKNGYYYESSMRGVSGVEAVYDNELSGINGKKILETSVEGSAISESIIEAPQNGKEILLSIDAELQSQLYSAIKSLSEESDFEGGGGVIIDSFTGEILAVTSYPEFNREKLNTGTEKPSYLNRATQGLYTPGSIVKPFIALAGLTEGVINEHTIITSTKKIIIPNPYDKTKPTVFHDWKELGPLDVRGALSNSPNSFFFAVGGGYQGVKGIGIEKIGSYMNAFGIGKDVSIDGFKSAHSVVPSPSWKALNFNNEGWRLGDTYLTSIGQYGFQVTPLHMARAVAAIANNGVLVSPSLKKGGNNKKTFVGKSISEESYKIAQEGMEGTISAGTARTLQIPSVSVGAKTGTAEIGKGNKYVNSWVIGFFPSDTRRYSFAVVMEKAPRSNIYGATKVMRDVFIWMKSNRPEYLGIKDAIFDDTNTNNAIPTEPLIR